MPNIKISQLPSATSLLGTEAFPVVQGGVTKQAAVSLVGGITYNSSITQALVDATPSGSTIYVDNPATISSFSLGTKIINFVFKGAGGTFSGAGGFVTVTGTVTIDSCTGNLFAGNGANLLWAGNTTDPMFLLSRNQFMSFRDMSITSSPSAKLAAAFQTLSTNTGQVSHGLRFTDVIVNGTNNGGLNYGWQFGVNGVSNGNNDDEHVLTRCVVDNYDKAGYAIQQPESKAHRFYDCGFSPTSVGLYGLVTFGAHGGDGGGSFYWMGGGGGGNKEADFGIGPADDVIVIEGFEIESSNRLLETSASSSPWPITIRNGRWAGDALNADNHAINYSERGPLILLNNTFENPNNVALDLFLSSTGRCQGIAIGNHVNSTLDNPFTTASTANGRWLQYGNNLGDPSPVPLPMTVPVLNFSELPTVGPAKGMLLIINDSTVNTWGANITVGGGGIPVLAVYNGTNWTVAGI